MADIAFLLLIFFLVTTTILDDTGILVKLPPYETVEPQPVPPRNLLRVALNAQDELLLNGEPARLDQVRDRVREFVLNPRRRLDLPARPSQAVVSLLHDRSTGYAPYLAVYDEVKGAYRELWEERAGERYGAAYAELPPSRQRAVRAEIPLLISEADPVDYGKE